MLDFFYSVDESNRIIQNTVLEFCDQSLEHLIKEAQEKKSYIPMRSVKKYVRQLFDGLTGMHAVGVAHSDLKPENVLLKNDDVKIADVGSSKVLDFSAKRLNTPYVVSRFYRAPELILASNHYDHSIDIWAAGCIIFEMLTKTAMFPGDSEGLQLVEM